MEELIKSIAPDKVKESGLVFGEGCPLNSLDFIEFLLQVEKVVKDKTGQDIRLYTTENALKYSFRTIEDIAGIVQALTGDCCASLIINESGEQPTFKKPDNPTKRARPQVKLVMCDLDGTLWEGIAGEEVVEEKELVTKHLKKLSDNGVLLGLVTRNYKDIVEKEVSKLQLNWIVQFYDVVDKAEAIREAAQQVNIGLDSVVFIDDDEHELDNVRAIYPKVRCLDKPDGILGIKAEATTQEDRQRKAMIVQEFERKRDASNFPDRMKWLESLKMVLTISEAKSSNQRERALQLLNRSNQFNFWKRDYYDLEPIMNGGKHRPEYEYVAELSDRIGDSGIIAVIRILGNKVFDFCISCRVLGRGIEETLVKWAFSKGVKSFDYQGDERNLAAGEFLKKYMGEKDDGLMHFWEKPLVGFPVEVRDRT